MEPIINISTIKERSVEIIEQLGGVIREITPSLSVDKKAEYLRVGAMLDNEVKKLQKLELSVAVVAPMKAGKSTIVNAITGRALLPTRNIAMTTFPTEIAMLPSVDRASLILSKSTRHVCQDIANKIVQRINAHPLEMVKVTKPAPHLKNTIDKIMSGVLAGSLPTRLIGEDNISSTLTLLNDLIRISSYLGISIESINELEDLPRIEVPISDEIPLNNILGSLVIIDTPGPNEAGQHHLGAIVQNQLRRSSAVLVVLNFSELTSTASDELKKDVEKVIAARGKENLFVLVNKIDQRNSKNDLPKEEVLSLVKDLFAFDDPGFKDRVFEISAFWAFISGNALVELETNEQLDVDRDVLFDMSNIPAVESLLQIVDPVGWEERIQDISKREVADYAVKLRIKSNFDPFVEKIVTKLVNEAAPIAIRSSINQCYKIVEQVEVDAAFRAKGIDLEVDKIESEIADLASDLKQLEAVRENLDSIDEVRSQLEEEIDDITSGVSREIPESVKKNFQNKDIAFKDVEDAKIFAESIGKLAMVELRNVVVRYQIDVVNAISKSQKNISKSLSGKIRPTMEKIHQRMENNFDAKISFVEPDIADFEVFISSVGDISLTKRQDWKWKKKPVYERRKKDQSLLDWILGAQPEYERVPVGKKKHKKYFDIYAVDEESVYINYVQAIETHIQIVNSYIQGFLDKEIKEQIKLFFEELDAYLGRYRSTLEQIQTDNKLSSDEQTELKTRLNEIQQNAGSHRVILNEVMANLGELFPEL